MQHQKGGKLFGHGRKKEKPPKAKSPRPLKSQEKGFSAHSAVNDCSACSC
jgi:hypothetical protein